MGRLACGGIMHRASLHPTKRKRWTVHPSRNVVLEPRCGWPDSQRIRLAVHGGEQRREQSANCQI